MLNYARAATYVLEFLILITGTIVAQEAPPGQVPDKTRIPVRFNSPVAVEDISIGQIVYLTITKDVKVAKATLIPKGATAVARITEATAYTPKHLESRLSLVVIRAEWPGASLALNAFIAGEVNVPGNYAMFDGGGQNRNQDVGCRENSYSRTAGLRGYRNLRLKLLNDPELNSVFVCEVSNVFLPKGTTVTFSQWQ